MSILEWCAWLENSRVGLAIGETGWLFPIIETVHVLALTLVVGSIAMVDLRLLGVSSRNMAVTRLTEDILPVTWIAFCVAVVSGGLLFTSNATKYFGNQPFRFKLLLIALAGFNMLVFQLITYRRVHEWDLSPSTARGAKLAGFVSLLCWVGVVVLGRWMAFV